MTPLAQAWLNDRLLPKRKQRFNHQPDILGYFEEFHFFEVTNYAPEMEEFAVAMSHTKKPTIRLSFLPAPKTWIEWREVDGLRTGLGVVEQKDKQWARFIVLQEPDLMAVEPCEIALREHMLKDDQNDPEMYKFAAPPTRELLNAITIPAWQLYAGLALINSPRTIGRTRHGPHRGLQRKLASRPELSGHNFNLIHETLELEVRPPIEELGTGKQGTLTGARALHYCRAYLWQTRGLVCPGHWRGDPSRGIKVRDYSLVPAKNEKFKDWKPTLENY